MHHRVVLGFVTGGHAVQRGWRILCLNHSPFNSPLDKKNSSLLRNKISTVTDDHDTSSTRLLVPSTLEMEEIGALLSSLLVQAQQHHPRPNGEVILLDGDLGAGKTTFARGFIRAATGDWEQRVTSPTYLLSNTYTYTTRPLDQQTNVVEIHHMDLYRLSGQPQDLVPLNLRYVFSHCISLVEWSSRLEMDCIPSERLNIEIRIQKPSEDKYADESDEIPRIMTLSPHGKVWKDRIRKLFEEGYWDDILLAD